MSAATAVQAVGPTIAPEPARGTRDVRWLVAGIVFVVVMRLGFYPVTRDFPTDFDLLYYSAVHLLQGQNPYPIVGQWSDYPLFYPLPAVLLAAPFTALTLEQARPTFDIVIGSAFAYVLWRYRGPYALLALVSGAYLVAAKNGQTTPLMVAAGLVPALGFLLPIKPNMGLALWAARPSRQAVVGSVAVLLISLLIVPSWPMDWWAAIHQNNAHIRSPITRPFGWILLLAALRWRAPEGRLLLALALLPQNSVPHELVPLALVPANAVQMGIYIAGTWLCLGAAAVTAETEPFRLSTLTAAIWPMMLLTVYLPMLWLVLRGRSQGVSYSAAPIQPTLR